MPVEPRTYDPNFDYFAELQEQGIPIARTSTGFRLGGNSQMNNDDERDYAEEAANAELLRNPDPEPTGDTGQLITVQIRFRNEWAMDGGADLAEQVRKVLVDTGEAIVQFQEHSFVTSHVREYRAGEHELGKQFISPRGDAE